MLEEGRGPKLCIVGAADDTGNLGVTALMRSIVGGVMVREPSATVTLFDNGRGERSGSVPTPQGPASFTRHGMWPSRRFYRPESLFHMRATSRFGARYDISRYNPGAAALTDADAVWDASGGDSFGDLYGEQRWRLVVQPKQLVLAAGVPLVLMPQTYGPFYSADHRRVAREIVLGSRLAWARDADSFEVLRDLAGADFDASRQRLGVDVAFGLPATAPPGVERSVRDLLGVDQEACLVGVNPSGLLYNDASSRATFGLSVDYRTLIERLIRRLLEVPEVTVVLVPHVVGGGRESDEAACRDLTVKLTPRFGDRLIRAPSSVDPSETKWLIGQMTWFCGTRMHSTIAALSSGVPVAAIAYSSKTRGVFESCGASEHVADARTGSEDSVLEALLRSFEDHAALRRVLEERLPGVRETWNHQMSECLRVSRHTGREWPGREGVASRVRGTAVR